MNSHIVNCLERQPELARQRPGIFQQVAGRPGSFPEPVPVDFDPLAYFVALIKAAALGRDDRDAIAGLSQRARLLPHATVEWHGEIFDDNEDRYF